jgi:hypothetical protein
MTCKFEKSLPAPPTTTKFPAWTESLAPGKFHKNLQLKYYTHYDSRPLKIWSQKCSTIELCTAIATYPEYVCTLFPNDVPCSCPLAASVYYNPSAYVTFTSEWLAIDGGVNVSDQKHI